VDRDRRRTGRAQRPDEARPAPVEGHPKELEPGPARPVAAAQRERAVELDPPIVALSLLGSRADPGPVDEHRLDLIQVAPGSPQVAARRRAAHDPAKGPLGGGDPGLAAERCLGPPIRQLGAQLKDPTLQAGGDPPGGADPEHREQRREAMAAAAPDHRQGEIEPADPGEQPAAPTAAPTKPRLGPATRTLERRCARRGSIPRPARGANQLALAVREHGGEQLRAELLAGADECGLPAAEPGSTRGEMDADEVGTLTDGHGVRLLCNWVTNSVSFFATWWRMSTLCRAINALLRAAPNRSSTRACCPRSR
jgi:hypothetical protein